MELAEEEMLVGDTHLLVMVMVLIEQRTILEVVVHHIQVKQQNHHNMLRIEMVDQVSLSLHTKDHKEEKVEL